MKIYCLGIGGIGLSAYAAIQHAAGHMILGSDRCESALIDDLRSQGITVSMNQSGSEIPKDTDLIVYSEAIPETSPERMSAHERGIPQWSYPRAVGEIAKGKFLIAVAGSHGKSSTTAMAAKMLIDAGKDPTIVVGTKLRELRERNWRSGASDMFLLEACEYRHSFLSYNPSIILLTTCDGDHFDFYTSQEMFDDAFRQFIGKLPADGLVITHSSDPDCARITKGAMRQVIDADTQPLIDLATPGQHMKQNAQLVLALAEVLGITLAEAKKSISAYEGSWRRMEEKGLIHNQIPVVDDYAHHPREIRATLEALREKYFEKRMVVVFQPHTHDRTFKLYNDFTKAFAGVDLLMIPNIYDARSDIEHGHVDVDSLVADIAKESGIEAVNTHSLAETENLLKNSVLKEGDVVICMGAGDITNLATALVHSS